MKAGYKIGEARLLAVECPIPKFPSSYSNFPAFRPPKSQRKQSRSLCLNKKFPSDEIQLNNHFRTRPPLPGALISLQTPDPRPSLVSPPSSSTTKSPQKCLPPSFDACLVRRLSALTSPQPHDRVRLPTPTTTRFLYDITILVLHFTSHQTIILISVPLQLMLVSTR